MPYIASTATSACARAACEALADRSPAASSNTRRPHAPAPRAPRGDQAVAAVVALAADQHDPAPVGTADEPPHLPRHRASRPVHEHLDRGARGDRAPIGVAHGVGRQDGFHDARLSPTASTTAIAVVSVCVSESCHACTPRSSASAAAAPCSASDGRAAVVAYDLDLAEAERAEADAQRLHHRLLGAEAQPPGCCTGSCCPYAYSCSPSVKSRSESVRPARQREAEPRDLDQVGPEAADPEPVASRGRRSRQRQRSART